MSLVFLTAFNRIVNQLVNRLINRLLAVLFSKSLIIFIFDNFRLFFEKKFFKLAKNRLVRRG